MATAKKAAKKATTMKKGKKMNSVKPLEEITFPFTKLQQSYKP